jgi:uncharacterized protein (DUF433 family)
VKDEGWRERHPLIVKAPGYCFGKAALGNSRVRVNNVICCARQGHTRAQILEEDYPDLTEAQVEAAFAYYREFPREIDAELARDECGELIFAARKAEALRYLAARAAAPGSGESRGTDRYEEPWP